MARKKSRDTLDTAETLDLVAKTTDPALLEDWAKKDKRPPVQKAIAFRLGVLRAQKDSAAATKAKGERSCVGCKSFQRRGGTVDYGNCRQEGMEREVGVHSAQTCKAYAE